MTNRTIHHHEGFSLVELMIGITLGAFILLVLSNIFGATVLSNAATLASARLNQDLSAAVEVMANDLRRAGYTNGQMSYDDVDLDLNLPGSACVTYSYNRNGDTNIDDNERFGFALAGSAIRMRNSCGAGGAACSNNCDNGAWQQVTDPNVVSITNLTLSTTGSKCMNLDTLDYWITTSGSATDFPCEDTNAGNLTNYVYDAVAGSYSVGAFTAPASGERTVETRQVNIRIVGELTNDATVTKEVDAQVKIRNDRQRTTP